MPAGAVGSCWVVTAWPDTAWEANAWAEAVIDITQPAYVAAWFVVPAPERTFVIPSREDD